MYIAINMFIHVIGCEEEGEGEGPRPTTGVMFILWSQKNTNEGG